MHNFTERQIEIMKAATNRIDEFGIQNLTIKTLAEDIGLSEPALYRHFKSKNEILLSLLEFFNLEIKGKIKNYAVVDDGAEPDMLRSIFQSQLSTFEKNPAIISVIFAESIFQYDESLSDKVAEIMQFMHKTIENNISNGQAKGYYSKIVDVNTATIIVTGSMRMAVMKLKLYGSKSNLVNDGMVVLNGILKMIKN